MVKKIIILLVLCVFLLLGSCELYYSMTLNGTWYIDYTLETETTTEKDTSRAGDEVIFDLPTMDELNSDGSIYVTGEVSELTSTDFLRTHADETSTFVEYSIDGKILTLHFYSEEGGTDWGIMVCTKEN